MSTEESVEEIDFQKYYEVIRRRWQAGAAVFGVTLILSVLYALTRTPMYEAEATLLFKTNRTSSLTGLGEDLGRLETLNLDDSPLDTQAQIVRSIPIMEEVVATLALTDKKGRPLKPTALANNLEVKGIQGTDVLSISYISDDPEAAAEVTNTVAEIYIRNNLQTNRAEASSAREFISEQLPKTEEAVRQADSYLRRFKEENGITVLEDEAKASVQIISSLEEEISQARAQLSDATARLADLQTKVGLNSQQALLLASLTQSAGIQEVVTQLQQAQTQLAIDQTRYVSSHPTIVNQERKIDALNTLLEERIGVVLRGRQLDFPQEPQLGPLNQSLIADLIGTETEREGIAQRINTLFGNQAEYRQRARSFPRLEQTQRELERRLQVAQTTYENLLARLQEIQVAENQNIGNARIISPALVPDNSSGSNNKLILAGGFLIGIFFGIAVVFILDLVDRSLKSVKDARECFGFTLLGMIPALSGLNRRDSQTEALGRLLPKVVVREQPRSLASESYRVLQTNLKFLDSDKTIKSVVVTSSISHEGKSEVAANLAAAIAQGGRSVLLVDASLRHPIQHHVWNLNNVRGLTNVLVKQATLQDCVYEPMPNLHVLTAGLIPPNPVALLDSDRMATLLREFFEQYDFVILDAPPLIGVADASILGKLVDGTLLVVQLGLATFDSAEAAKEILGNSRQTVLGMVLNRVEGKHDSEHYLYSPDEGISNIDILEDISFK